MDMFERTYDIFIITWSLVVFVASDLSKKNPPNIHPTSSVIFKYITINHLWILKPNRIRHIRYLLQLCPFSRSFLHFLSGIYNRIRHRRLPVRVETRIRCFDHLREIPRSLVEQ
jgi:hypothetical protein